jgi:hypothetical protein
VLAKLRVIRFSPAQTLGLRNFIELSIAVLGIEHLGSDGCGKMTHLYLIAKNIN